MLMSDMVLRKETKDADGNIIVDGGGYGPELALDCELCRVAAMTERSIRAFLRELCKVIEMKPESLFVQIVEGNRITAIQFILTSNITIHTEPAARCVFVNIFSCKVFDSGKARAFTQNWFDAQAVREHLIQRG